MPDAVSDYGLFLQVIEADSLVFRNQYPTFFPDEGQPRSVLRSRRKVLTMTFVLDPVLREGIQDRFAVMKVFVEKKNEVFRRRWPPSSAPSG